MAHCRWSNAAILRPPFGQDGSVRALATPCCWRRPAPASTSSAASNIEGKYSNRSCVVWRLNATEDRLDAVSDHPGDGRNGPGDRVQRIISRSRVEVQLEQPFLCAPVGLG